MSKPRQFSRRQFLQTTGAIAGGVAAASLASHLSGATPAAAIPSGFSVNINDTNIPPGSAVTAPWALDQLRAALTAKGVPLRPQADLTINFMLASLAGAPLVQGAETFALAPAGPTLLSVHYSDAAGLAYALTELADRVRLSSDPRTALTLEERIIEKPATPYRGTVRLFVSEPEDKRWFYDREGWQKHFDMLVTRRFNRFNLSFGLSYDFSTNLTDTYTFFMYPFFVDVPGYKVRAIAKGGTPLSTEEQQKNLDTLKFISDQAALRGLKFTLGIWTQNYRWTNSPNATYTIDGLDAQTQPTYCRDAIKTLIDACPGITGLNIRTHGESGVPEGSYDIWKIILSGMMGHKNADGTPRILDLDLHAKTMTQEMIDTAATTGMPLILSCKQWAEHAGLPYLQASIRESEMPKTTNGTGLMALSSGTRSFLRYGVGDLLRTDRNFKVIHRVWPGTQKLLLWGDPLYAAENGRMASFAGADGIDYFEPLSFRGRAGSSLDIPPAPDRSGYADASLRAPRDLDKYAYTFRLWGRLAYNPDAPAETWQRQLQTDFGGAAAPMENALANASRILLLITTAHDPSAAGDSYWTENYTNQSLYDPASSPYSEVPQPRVFGNVSPLDPQIFSTPNEYADALLGGKPSAKVSPLDLARQLETWSSAVMDAVIPTTTKQYPAALSPVIRRAQIDAQIVAGVGQFFAHKFRAAVLWQLFNRSGEESARTAALVSYKKARDAWATLADTGKVYLPNLTFGGKNIRGHWADRLPAIDADIAGAAKVPAAPQTASFASGFVNGLIQDILHPQAAHIDIRVATPQHVPQATFKPKEAIALDITSAGHTSARLWYRHLHQGEHYAAVDMQKDGTKFTAAIPAGYTDASFPIQYYFELRGEKSAALFPGFKENFTGTPYFLVMPA